MEDEEQFQCSNPDCPLAATVEEPYEPEQNVHFERTEYDEQASKTSRVKATAGVVVASIVVLSFVSIGFLIMTAQVFLGVDIEVPGDWSAAMLSLASAAMGYLIGKAEPLLHQE